MGDDLKVRRVGPDEATACVGALAEWLPDGASRGTTSYYKPL